MKNNQNILKWIIAALLIGSTSSANGASLERLLITGGIGAGIGQAIGHNTESTLIGAASAVLLDGYLNPQPRQSAYNIAPTTVVRPSVVQYSQPVTYTQQPVIYRSQPTVQYRNNHIENYDYQTQYRGGEFIESTTTTVTTTTTHGYEPVW